MFDFGLSFWFIIWLCFSFFRGRRLTWKFSNDKFRFKQSMRSFNFRTSPSGLTLSVIRICRSLQFDSLIYSLVAILFDTHHNCTIRHISHHVFIWLPHACCDHILQHPLQSPYRVPISRDTEPKWHLKPTDRSRNNNNKGFLAWQWLLFIRNQQRVGVTS